MRLLTRKIHRAFPELDAYDDAQCRRFIKAARASPAVQAAHLTAVLAAVVPLLLASLLAVVAISDRFLGAFTDGTFLLGTWASFFWMLACFPILATGPVAGGLVRDVLLRRRLRFVLRTRGFCPTCRYSLIGLPLSARSTVVCPECGVEVEVDPSLGELSRQGTGRVLIAGIVADPYLFWTPARRRLLRRTLAVLALLVFVVIPGVAGLYELRVRSEAAAARADAAALQAELAAFLAKAAPPAAGPDGWDAVSAAAALLDAEDGPAWRNTLTTAPNAVAPEFSFLLRTDRILTQTASGETPAQNRASAELARAMLARYGKAGVYEALGRVVASRSAVVPADLLGGSSFQHSQRFQPLYAARRLSRMGTGRMAVAAAAGDRRGFMEAVEASLALARVCESCPLYPHTMTGLSIEALVHSDLRWWVRSGDFHAEWLTELRQVLDRQRAPLKPEVVMEAWRLEQRMVVADYFSAPANVRLGRYSPAFQAATNPGFITTAPPGLVLGSYARNTRTADGLFRAIAPDASRPAHARTGFLPPADASSLGLLFSTRLALTQCLAPFDRVALDRAGLDALLAIEAYRARHGAPPPDLAALVPELLPRLPMDPWSGAPLVYRTLDPGLDAGGRSYTLYAVGPDGKDDGGKGIQPDAAFTQGPDVLVNDPNQ